MNLSCYTKIVIYKSRRIGARFTPKDTSPREILICHTDDDRKPFAEWFYALDGTTRGRVRVRIDRIEDGNFGDVAPVGGGVSELRLDFGPGYRIYFGQIGNQVHLIRAGLKNTQPSDIRFAKQFWKRHD